MKSFYVTYIGFIFLICSGLAVQSQTKTGQKNKALPSTTAEIRPLLCHTWITYKMIAGGMSIPIEEQDASVIVYQPDGVMIDKDKYSSTRANWTYNKGILFLITNTPKPDTQRLFIQQLDERFLTFTTVMKKQQLTGILKRID